MNTDGKQFTLGSSQHRHTDQSNHCRFFSSCSAQKSTSVDARNRLPVAQPVPAKVTKVLPSQVPMPKPFSVDAPKGAPNVVIIMLDDVGYGAPSTFGGKINMPTFGYKDLPIME